MKKTEQTEAATEPMEDKASNHSTLIELSVVHGETSGLFRIDERTGTTTFAEDITYEQWKEVLRLARTLRNKASVVVADCISLGLKKWGRKKVDDALEQLEFEATLVKSGVAIGSIPVELRLEHLEPEHIVELARADLPKAQKIRWARIASEQKLTATQLRFSIIEGEVVDKAATRMLHTGLITIQGIRQSFDVWKRRVGGLDGIKALELDNQIEIMEELEAIVEFGLQLDEHLNAIQEAKGQTNNETELKPA